MIELLLPELSLEELTLPCVDTARGSDSEEDDQPPPLTGRISLGGPHSRKISTETVAADPQLTAFVEQESPYYEYHLVFLSISFAAQPVTPRLRSATVRLGLTSVPAAPAPIALSMTPFKLTDQVKVQRELHVEPQLELHEAKLSLGEYSRTSSFTHGEPFLWALGLDDSSARWEFKRTANIQLTGAHRLVMIVRAGTGSTTNIDCTVTARTGGNISRRFERQLPDPLKLVSLL